MQFSSFKAKTGGPAKATTTGKVLPANKSASAGKTMSVSGSKTAPAKKADEKRPPAPRKDGVSSFLVLVVSFSLVIVYDLLGLNFVNLAVQTDTCNSSSML